MKLNKQTMQFGIEKNKFKNKDQHTEEKQLRIGENFYLPIYFGIKKIMTLQYINTEKINRKESFI